MYFLAVGGWLAEVFGAGVNSWDFRVEYLVGAAKGVGAGEGWNCWGLGCVSPGIGITRGNFRRGRTPDMTVRYYVVLSGAKLNAYRS